MSSQIRNKLVTPEDGQAIIELYDIVWPEDKPDLNHWKWEFLDNPVGAIFTFIAEVDGKIVGQSGLLPTWLNWNGKKILGAQAIDAMTHPAYRKKGIYTSLAKESDAYAASQGVSIFYGIPNDLSYPIRVKKLGFADLGAIPYLVKILDRKSLIWFH